MRITRSQGRGAAPAAIDSSLRRISSVAPKKPLQFRQI
jgi:hypothetical protein